MCRFYIAAVYDTSYETSPLVVTSPATGPYLTSKHVLLSSAIAGV